MPLIVTGAPPLHWLLAGASIAGVTLVLLYVGNRRLGISSGFEDLCSLALRIPYFQRATLLDARRWRLPFLAGLVIGGWLSASLAHGWSATWSVPMLDHALALGPVGKLAWMFAGGLFIGFGTRLAGGCTSGHGIFGLANFELSSLVTTIAFMASGIATTQLLYRVVLR
jgi:uncharacterized protein